METEEGAHFIEAEIKNGSKNAEDPKAQSKSNKVIGWSCCQNFGYVKLDLEEDDSNRAKPCWCSDRGSCNWKTIRERCGVCFKKYLCNIPVLSFNLIIVSDAVIYLRWNVKLICESIGAAATVIISIFILLLLSMLYWSWYAVATTSSKVQDNVPPYTVQTGHMRLCKQCLNLKPYRNHNGLKPWRAHHCRLCDRCVLKMDHHCIFLAQCIGLMNYKFFCLFVFYAILISLLYVVLTIPTSSFLGKYSIRHDSLLSVEAIVTSVSVLLTFITLVFLIIFAKTHVYLILSSSTTIEYLKGETADIGLSNYEKFTQIFGEEKRLWLFPVGKPKENGYEFSCPELKNPQMRVDSKFDI